MRWHIDLIEANLESRLIVLNAIDFAAGTVLVQLLSEVSGSRVRSSKQHRLRVSVHNDYRKPSLPFQQHCCDLAGMIKNLGVSVRV